jgi:hypothetical protein
MAIYRVPLLVIADKAVFLRALDRRLSSLIQDQSTQFNLVAGT